MEWQSSTILRKILIALAAFGCAMALIALGWMLHPAASPPVPVISAAAPIADPFSAATSAHEQTSLRTPAAMRITPSTHIPVAPTGQTPKSASDAPPRSAPHNIIPNAPPWTSNDKADTPIDSDLALSLFADRIAHEENNEADDDKFDIPHLRRKLEIALPNSDATSILRADLDSWVTQFAPAIQEHLSIALAECRGDYCRILIAINSFKSRVVGNRSNWEFAGGFNMNDLEESLMSQPWWKAMTSGMFTTQQVPAQQQGYVLFSVYFKLPATPSASAAM